MESAKETGDSATVSSKNQEPSNKTTGEIGFAQVKTESRTSTPSPSQSRANDNQNDTNSCANNVHPPANKSGTSVNKSATSASTTSTSLPKTTAPTTSTTTATTAATTSDTTAPTITANTFLPLTRARKKEHISAQEVTSISAIFQPAGAEMAAKRSRLSPHKLSEIEYSAFFDLLRGNIKMTHLYLYTRNRILEKWYDNLQTELTKDEVLEALDYEKYEDIPDEARDSLISRTYEYLDRLGYINFGIFEPKQNPSKPKLLDRSKRAPLMSHNLYKPPLKSGGKRVGRVIIIGAGLSGLAAARQLQRFGMEVIVLEARNRVGGRVHTYRKGQFIADLGPNSLNGIVGNPMMVLGRQLELLVTELKQKIPIYENKIDKNGDPVCHQVEHCLEKAVEREYNKIMEGTRVLKNNYKVEKYHGESFPVGMAVDWVMKLQEKNVKDDQVRYLGAIENLYKQLIESANKKLERSRTIKKLHGELCSIKDSTDLGNHKDKKAIDLFNRRCLARDLDIALREYKLLIEQEEEIHNKIAALTKCPPSDTYLKLSDRRLLDWHFAELEYALGCPINKLAIYYEDDEQLFAGNHWMLVHGFSTIVEALKTDLDIQLSTAVKKVTVTKNGVKVLTYNPDHSNVPYTELTADAVLCTTPLGSMKDSIIPSVRYAVDGAQSGFDQPRTTQKGYQPMIFSPPLPKWKTQAYERLGCGNLNKIVLHFDKSFWDQHLHLFGVVDHKAISRGQFFLFWHYGRTPTLTGLISGEAADMMERLSDVEILEKCIDVLRSIYGISNVPVPRDYVVTRWRKDPWARGAWSFLKTGSSGEDYTTCAEPVVLAPNESQYQEVNTSKLPIDVNSESPFSRRQSNEFPRLFFAGEHTTKHHFASAHGAVMTGLREAARIANTFMGCPYDIEEGKGIYFSGDQAQINKPLLQLIPN